MLNSNLGWRRVGEAGLKTSPDTGVSGVGYRVSVWGLAGEKWGGGGGGGGGGGEGGLGTDPELT